MRRITESTGACRKLKAMCQAILKMNMGGSLVEICEEEDKVHALSTLRMVDYGSSGTTHKRLPTRLSYIDQAVISVVCVCVQSSLLRIRVVSGRRTRPVWSVPRPGKHPSGQLSSKITRAKVF